MKISKLANALLSKRSRLVVLATAATACFPVAAFGQWELTPPYTAAGWKISNVTTNVPEGGSLPGTDNGYGTLFGFAFGLSSKYNGGKPYFMFAEANNNSNGLGHDSTGLVVLNSDTDNQSVGPALTPLLNPLGLTSVNGLIYAAVTTEEKVVQVNPDGTVGASFGSGLSTICGLTVNPLNGHILAVSYGGPQVLDIDPVSGKVQTLMQLANANGAEGIATDGKSIFVSALVKSDNGGPHIQQFAIPTTLGATVSPTTDFGYIYFAVGVALGANNSLYVNCHHGQVYQINRTTKAISLLANWDATWRNGYFISPDPINGSLLIGGANVGRITPPPSYSLQFATPVLNSATLAETKSMPVTICLAEPAPVDFKVTLTATSNLTLSASTVTIKAGTTTATVNVTGGTVAANQGATVGATITLPAGTITQTASFTVTH